METTTTFLGLDAHWWLVVGTWVLAATTFALVLGALYQVWSIREENRKATTLAICNRYECDPVLYECLEKLWQGRTSGELEKEPKKYRVQLVTLLNYLDGIAIGVEQGLYIEELARDHMEAIVAVHVKGYIESGIIERAGVPRENFLTLISLRGEWSKARPRFADRRLSRWRRKKR